MKYIYEFIGTFFLVFTVGMTVIGPNSAGLLAPVAIGSALAVMVYAGGHVSGGHYNPAVSLAVFMRGRLTSKDLGKYWLVQFIAGIVAGYLTIYFKGNPAQTPLALEMVKGFLAEFLFAFALCFVVLNAAIAKGTKGNSFYGWAIGFTILIGAYAVGSISGAAFNPAVALGLTIMKFSVWSNLWIYLVANFLGGVCAAGVFKAVDKKT
jgi:aquaporin Z